MCMVCLAAPKRSLLLPCKHLCLCDCCSGSFKAPGMKCPVCRVDIQDVVSGVFDTGHSGENRL